MDEGAPPGARTDAPVVHLFRAAVGDPPFPEEHLAGYLSEKEQARAARFHFERDVRRFRVAWGLLRTVLGRWVDEDPARLEFTVSDRGKPGLRGGPSFNLSHSGEWVLIGVTDGGRLGVDIEVVRPVSRLEDLARRTFAPEETSELLDLPETERQEAFFRVWTRKEAFIKAVGDGLYRDLTTFAVRADRGPGSTLVRLDDPGESVDRWTVRTVVAPPGAEATVALDAPTIRVREREVQGG
jgi:4'-phosphopantetheinyl transferase